MAPPDLADLAIQGVRTLRELSQRVPGAGSLLAPSVEGAAVGRNILITGASSGIGRSTAIKLGEAGGTMLLVSRGVDALNEVKAEIEARDGIAYVHPCDLSDPDDIDRMAREVLERHEAVDILINNAGKSIRRSVDRAYDRFHDYQRTMQLNYFGPLKLILDLLPVMREQGFGHIVNVSTIGLQVNTPRFSAYVASKAALDAFSRSIAPEVIGDGVHVTTVYMPLVRTPMIAPSKHYDRFPTLSPEEAADMICEAVRKRPKRIATPYGTLGQLTYAVAPGAQDLLVNRAYQLFPEGDSSGAKERSNQPRGEEQAPDGEQAPGEEQAPAEEQTPQQIAFARATPGVHW